MTTDQNVPQEQIVSTPQAPEGDRPYAKSGGATTLQKYGPEHFANAGKKSAQRPERTKEYYAQLGRLSSISKKKKKLAAAKRLITRKENKSPAGIISRFLQGKLK